MKFRGIFFDVMAQGNNESNSHVAGSRQTRCRRLWLSFRSTVHSISPNQLFIETLPPITHRSTQISKAMDQVKALTFDVFGTCVDWRQTVTTALAARADARTHGPQWDTVPENTRVRVEQLKEEDWAKFAEEWRKSYHIFTRTFVPGQSVWKDIDTHHYDSLVKLFHSWHLTGLYDDADMRKISLVWHFLRPWEDSSEGIHKLGTRFTTATLSNGNIELLKDLDKHGNLGFREFLSAADFKAYKPNPEVYVGAARKLGLAPCEVAMVAAHLGDLEAARSCGFRTVYVERKGEEKWKESEERYGKAKEWVDIWISEGEGGFVELAKRLGIS